MSRLLLDEQPLLIMPQLAVKIGLNESIILQQVHYWIDINKKANKNFRDGFYWVYNTYEEWQENFPFWSLSTIKRTISKLENNQLLVSGNYNKLKIDRTKWYRIGYETLKNLEKLPSGQNDPTNVSDCTEQEVNMNRPLPEITSETTISKITKDINNITSSFKNQNEPQLYKDINDFMNEVKENTDNDNIIIILRRFYNDYTIKYKGDHFKVDDMKVIVEKTEKFIEYIKSLEEDINTVFNSYLHEFFNNGTTHSIYRFLDEKSINYFFNKLGYIDSVDVFESTGELREELE